MNKRTADTIKVSGGADYAKVAERVKLFREDFPKSKIETEKSLDRDFEGNATGAILYKAWIWKDKTQLLELMAGGVTDKDVLRSSADSDGDMSGPAGLKDKDSEKMQTAAIGRALSNLGYLAGGEIAGFEELELKSDLEKRKNEAYVKEQIALFKKADADELLKLWLATDKTNDDIRAAKDARKEELGIK